MARLEAGMVFSVVKAIECYHRLPVILNETERQRLINEEVSVVAEIIQLVERVCRYGNTSLTFPCQMHTSGYCQHFRHRGFNRI